MHKLGDSKAVLIPKTICDMLNLDVGTTLEMIIENNKIILERINVWARPTIEDREDPPDWDDTD